MTDIDRAAPRIHQPEEMRQIKDGVAEYRLVLGEGAAQVSGGYFHFDTAPAIGDTLTIAGVFVIADYEVMGSHIEADPQQDGRAVTILSLRWINYA